MLSDTELSAMIADVRGAMPDTVLITRAKAGTTNPSTGAITSGTPTTVYNGVAHVRVPDSYELDVEFGGQEQTKQRYHIYLPEDITVNEVPHTDDILKIQAGGPVGLVGVPMRITAVTGGSWNLSYRVAGEVIET